MIYSAVIGLAGRVKWSGAILPLIGISWSLNLHIFIKRLSLLKRIGILRGGNKNFGALNYWGLI